MSPLILLSLVLMALALCLTFVRLFRGPSLPDRVVALARRLLTVNATHARRSFRRSSSEVPPHTPESWFVVSANSRHGSLASQVSHTALAAAICSSAGPVVPTGKKRSGSVSRHDE